MIRSSSSSVVYKQYKFDPSESDVPTPVPPTSSRNGSDGLSTPLFRTVSLPLVRHVNALFVVLIFNLLVYTHAFMWPWAKQPSTDAPLSSKAHDEFEAALSRNVGKMSDEKGVFGSRSRSNWLGHRFSETGSTSSKLEVLGDDVLWNFNDIGAMNVSGEFGMLMGFGDFNSDEHVDMFFVTPNVMSGGGSLAIRIRIWDALEHQFVSLPLFPLPKYITQVSGLVPIDIDLDGLVDVVVVSSHPVFDVLVMIQHPTSEKLQPGWYSGDQVKVGGVFFRSSGHPTVMDVNFDGFPDLVGQLDSSLVPSNFSKSGGRFVWINNREREFVPSFWGDEEIGSTVMWDKSELPPLSTPHSSAFIDLNGDCSPDLVFDVSSKQERYLEVWLSHLVRDMKDISTEEGKESSLNHWRHERESGRTMKSTTTSSVLDEIHLNELSFGSLFPSTDGSHSPQIGRASPFYILSTSHRLVLPLGIAISSNYI